MHKPKISIITIVYNGEKYIEKTVQSVVQQDYENIEYIVIDGGSTDNTPQILKKYQNKIAVWITEKDQGIYDAMNKGQNLATGELLWFLNGGDYIPKTDTLSTILQNYQNEDVLYGQAMIVNEKDEIIGLRRLVVPKKLTWKSFRLGMVVCHQAMIVKKSISETYDLHYKIAADIDWAIRTVKKSQKNRYIPTVFCHYLEGGFSEKKRRQSLLERWEIMQKHYGWWMTFLSHIQIALNLMLYKLGIRKNVIN